MNRDLGVWTSEDCALVLIDYQKEMFEAIRSETAADVVELHVRWLAKTARAFDMPIVLSTVGVEYGINSPTQPAILAELPDVEPIDRSSMNAFEDQAFREAPPAGRRLARTRTTYLGSEMVSAKWSAATAAGRAPTGLIHAPPSRPECFADSFRAKGSRNRAMRRGRASCTIGRSWART
jgi:hypothetical protein